MLTFLSIITLILTARADVSRPGGAGHALLFRDHGLLIENFKDLGSDALTFEAWISSSDYCHASALFSYAIDSTSTDPHQRTADFNSFVIFDPKKLVACRGFEYIDLYPDPRQESCYAKFNASGTMLPSFVERDGTWHHVAVVWTASQNGLTKIYKDGLLMIQTETGHTTPLPTGGALMLGAEQDCYGSCLDKGQNYYGYMDEVRVWRTARSQEDILKYMRTSSGLEHHPDLAAYWQFNDPEDVGLMREAIMAKDSSGKGNDIHLVTLPKISYTTEMSHALVFSNNYAMNQGFSDMPDGDISIEFWARTPAFSEERGDSNHHAEFFSFASYAKARPGSGASFQLLSDALLIEKYQKEYRGTADIGYKQFSTRGSVSIHVNANRRGNGKRNDRWVDFDTKWVDDKWHHIAMTWSKSSGRVTLFMDGEEKKAFWRSAGGKVEFKDPSEGGVDPTIATNTERGKEGSLVLGQLQECYGGCFSPQYNLHGDMAAVRIWSRVLSKEDVKKTMASPGEAFSSDGLVCAYSFASGVQEERIIRADPSSSSPNDLYLGADAPLWVYSEAPLALSSGQPVPMPLPGAAGHALSLSDQQVLILKNFDAFPSDEITVEFWMLSTDACRQGVPFSYAAGDTYSKNDNTFLIGNYQNWLIGVVEDEGTLGDHTSGVSSTDGQWHHIAVTWRSRDGLATLYDNGRMAWQVTRARGQHIPSGGTLVIGREQDCAGGCFDSAAGAEGSTQEVQDQEYGFQDFFGLIDEMRIWKVARTESEIRDGMEASLWQRGGGSAASDPPSRAIDPSDPFLVAYWNFDEGAGYTVKDRTGHGHDLVITKPPHWTVVRAFAVCGNGVVEGLEECDDGGVQDGDGCSSQCTVEPGWECTKTSPSVCWPSGSAGSPGPKDQPDGPVPPKPTPPSTKPTSKNASSHWTSMVVISLLAVAIGGMLGFAFVNKEQVLEAAPRVIDKARDIVRRFPFVDRQHRYYDLAAEFDAADMEGPPEFTEFSNNQGDRYQRLPGH